MWVEWGCTVGEESTLSKAVSHTTTLTTTRAATSRCVLQVTDED